MTGPLSVEWYKKLSQELVEQRMAELLEILKSLDEPYVPRVQRGDTITFVKPTRRETHP